MDVNQDTDREKFEVTEDGILVAKDCLTRFEFKTFDKRIVEFGSQQYPLNLYQNTQ